jgi:hypothetical protein
VVKTALTPLGLVALIAVVAIPVHFLGEVDWPWAIGIGAAASIVLRSAIHRAALRDFEKRPRG